jgi:hypothetical protein
MDNITFPGKGLKNSEMSWTWVSERFCCGSKSDSAHFPR